MGKLKVKVCGMRDPANITAVAALRPDFLGFILAPSSPRFIGLDFDPAVLKSIPQQIKTVGVFLNQSADEVKAAIDKFHFTHVQLHGEESPEYCLKVKSHHPQIELIKAFSVGSGFDIHGISAYLEVANHLLFDSSGSTRGGTGTTFDWNILTKYRGHKPIFLAGGISAEHATAVKRIVATIPMLQVIDLNSRFETSPGVKSIPLLSNFIREMRL